MARLEAQADAGEALINDELAAALPTSWVTMSKGGISKLRTGRVATGDPSVQHSRCPADDRDIKQLLPIQFHSLVDAQHRAGELKQVAMAFIRLNGTDDMLVADGVERLHQRIREITEIVDRAAAEFDVCWLETQAEANSVRWTLISGAPTATERDGERLLRVLRRITEQTPLPLRIGANLGVVFVGDTGHPRRCTFIVMGDATNLAARLMARAQPGEYHGRRAASRLVPRSVRVDASRAVPREGQEGARSGVFDRPGGRGRRRRTSPQRPFDHGGPRRRAGRIATRGG